VSKTIIFAESMYSKMLLVGESPPELPLWPGRKFCGDTSIVPSLIFCRVRAPADQWYEAGRHLSACNRVKDWQLAAPWCETNGTTTTTTTVHARDTRLRRHRHRQTTCIRSYWLFAIRFRRGEKAQTTRDVDV